MLLYDLLLHFWIVAVLRVLDDINMHDLGDQGSHWLVHFQNVADLIFTDSFSLLDDVASSEACLDIAFADESLTSKEAFLEESNN